VPSQPVNDLKRIARQAMLDHGLQPDFPAEAVAQTNSIKPTSSLDGSASRDLRGLLWASIDNDDSLDIDQLSVAEPLARGAVKVLVAIADVDATVQIESPIDEHARTNTTSVYTAAQIFPMLPEKLSTDLTSLAADQDRASIVMEMTVAGDGTVTESAIYRALVRNRAKLAYNSVAAWLDGTAPAPKPLAAVPGMDQQIRVQDEVAQRLRRVRRARGALTLETPEARAVFDWSRGSGDVSSGDSHRLSDLRLDEGNRAKDLIEDLMVTANGVVATFLESKGLPSLRRILRTPERWNRIVDLARGCGVDLPVKPDAVALNSFLDHSSKTDPDRFPDLSLSIVKLLGRGEYALKRPGHPVPGHFGLAVNDYTHSTAPNRRFPDLITQRLLKAALDGGKLPYTLEELDGLAAHCTEQQANADKVERSVRKSAAALLLASRIGQHFDGIVTGASDKGTWVRIAEPVAEGRVIRGFEGLDVGDHVRVELVHTDVGRGFIDFKRSN
jgi:VacB/RNase II family 3'-5' exoribonuclease